MFVAVEGCPASFDAVNVIAISGTKRVPAIVFAEIVVVGGNMSLMPLAMPLSFGRNVDTVLGKVKTLVMPVAIGGILIGIPVFVVPERFRVGVVLRFSASSRRINGNETSQRRTDGKCSVNNLLHDESPFIMKNFSIRVWVGDSREICKGRGVPRTEIS